MTRLLSLRQRPALLIIGGLIALKLAILFALAVRGRFVMDEFAQLGWAKYLGHGLFETIWPAKAVGYAIFFKLAHVIGWDARSILIAGRIETAILACATIALVYAAARALGQGRLRALAVVLVLLCFSNFIERSYRTIAEPVATFFAVAALYVAVRGRADQAGRILAAGALSGMAFLCTQKALYFDVALGLALTGDAALGWRFGVAFRRGALLVFGWLVPVILYCLIFGGSDPLAVARNLIVGPLGVASPQTAAEYGGLRHFVVQTLEQNALLYALCFAGMALALLRIGRLDAPRRIALIFSAVITALVFAHDQPWPYVFIMALPFVALWAMEMFDHLAGNALHVRLAWAVLGIAVAISFVRNVGVLRIDNRDQLALVARAESLVGPDEVYFDGIGMLPNRREPSTLWIDRHYVLKTLAEKQGSDAYRLFARTPPKLIIWSYRMDAIAPVVGPLIGPSYVPVAPNLRLAGVHLRRGEAMRFVVPVAGRYALYDLSGRPVQGALTIGGKAVAGPIVLGRGVVVVVLDAGPADALLLPQGSYPGKFASGGDLEDLFAGVYD